MVSPLHEPSTPGTVRVVTPACPFCGHCSVVEVFPHALVAWQGGTLIQDAFPDWSPDQRELFKTGSHAACWDAAFGEEV